MKRHLVARPFGVLARIAALGVAVALGACDGSSVVGGYGSDGGMDAAMDVPCATGEARCGGQCVSIRDNAMHCGGCGNACPAGNVCVNGTCMQSCPGAQTLCNGTLCVSLGTDRANCGACGNVCPTGQVCSNGACTLECASNLQTCTAGGGDAGADAGARATAPTR